MRRFIFARLRRRAGRGFAVMGVAALGLGGMMVAMAREDESEVNARAKRTMQDGRVEADADRKIPDAVTYTGEGSGRTMEIRKTLTPPDGFIFDPFRKNEKDQSRIDQARQRRPGDGNAWSYWEETPSFVDFWFDPETALLVQETPSTVKASAARESATSIEVRAVLLMPQTAAEFPLRCDGNLKPVLKDGGGSSPGLIPTEGHWAAKVVGGIELHIDADNNGTRETNWAPDRTVEERALRNHSQKPGRLIAVNNADSNTNGVPDFVEVAQTNRLVVMELDVGKIATAFDLASSQVTFFYADSDPAESALTSTEHTIAGKTVVDRLPKGYNEIKKPRLRLWTKDGPVRRNRQSIAAQGDYIPSNVGFPASKLTWQNRRAKIYIEGISAGTGTIEARFLPSGWPTEAEVGDTVKVTIVDIGLRPDRNHDRVIDANDRIANLRWPIYRFWKNNDQDRWNKDIMPDGDHLQTDAKGNAQKTTWIDGLRDLVDFFPVHVDIGQALTALALAEIEPKVLLRQGDGAVNMASAPSLTPQTSGQYHENIAVATDLVARNEFNAKKVPQDGLALTPECLGQARSTGKLVKLFEGRSNTEKPLVLEIRHPRNNSLILECKLPMRLSSTMEMMEWRCVPGSGVTRLSEIDQSVAPPPNWPKDETNDTLVIFIHGFMENNESVAGHASAIFKRLYWAGSKAGFAMVRWPADMRPGGKSGGIDAAFHFQLTLQNAIMKARSLAEQFVEFRGEWGQVTVISHSMGAWFTSEALLRAPPKTVDRFLMLNAAVPIEALGGENTAIADEMIHRDWRAYDPRLYMSEWWRLFDAQDKRHSLTWRGRYAALLNKTTLINAFSPTDDVLHLNDTAGSLLREVGRNARAVFTSEDMGGAVWQAQEVWKGRSILDITHDYGGWAFSRSWKWTQNGLEWKERWTRQRPLTPDQSREIRNEQLRTQPFFRHQGESSDVAQSIPEGLLRTPAAAARFIEDNEAELLARMIPAIAGPSGSRAVPVLSSRQNLNMHAFCIRPWPRPEEDTLLPWRHRDHRWLAYVYVQGLYKRIAESDCLNLK